MSQISKSKTKCSKITNFSRVDERISYDNQKHWAWCEPSYDMSNENATYESKTVHNLKTIELKVISISIKFSYNSNSFCGLNVFRRIIKVENIFWFSSEPLND